MPVERSDQARPELACYDFAAMDRFFRVAAMVIALDRTCGQKWTSHEHADVTRAIEDLLAPPQPGTSIPPRPPGRLRLEAEVEREAAPLHDRYLRHWTMTLTQQGPAPAALFAQQIEGRRDLSVLSLRKRIETHGGGAPLRQPRPQRSVDLLRVVLGSASLANTVFAVGVLAATVVLAPGLAPVVVMGVTLSKSALFLMGVGSAVAGIALAMVSDWHKAKAADIAAVRLPEGRWSETRDALIQTTTTAITDKAIGTARTSLIDTSAAMQKSADRAARRVAKANELLANPNMGHGKRQVQLSRVATYGPKAESLGAAALRRARLYKALGVAGPLVHLAFVPGDLAAAWMDIAQGLDGSPDLRAAPLP